MSEASEEQLIQSIVAQVKQDQLDGVEQDETEATDIPLGNVSASAAPSAMPVQFRAPAPRPPVVAASARAAPDWKDLLSMSVLKPIAVFTVLLFVLFQPVVMDLIKSVVPESLGVVGSFLPLILLSLVASVLIVLVNHFQVLA